MGTKQIIQYISMLSRHFFRSRKFSVAKNNLTVLASEGEENIAFHGCYYVKYHLQYNISRQHQAVAGGLLKRKKYDAPCNGSSSQAKN